MSLADIARDALSAENVRDVGARKKGATSTRHRVHADPKDGFDRWLKTGLQCAAGKREFRLGRYQVARVSDGQGYARALEDFRNNVASHTKTGFLAIFDFGVVSETVEDELRLLGAAMRDAGLTEDPAGLIAGDTLAHAMTVACPVTGRETAYEFFSVAFCRNAGDINDPLYDPSLSAPFTAINTTSDAFAFARLVNDTSMRTWGCAPYEINDRDSLELLFRRCVVAWQNMSITTIQSYSRVSADPARDVHLSEDQTHWYAAHNDPVFAELKKCPHLHEMPVAYAHRLTAKWSATLFDGQPYIPSRDGQSGGVPVPESGFAVEGLSGELFEF